MKPNGNEYSVYSVSIIVTGQCRHRVCTIRKRSTSYTVRLKCRWQRHSNTIGPFWHSWSKCSSCPVVNQQASLVSFSFHLCVDSHRIEISAKFIDLVKFHSVSVQKKVTKSICEQNVFEKVLLLSGFGWRCSHLGCNKYSVVLFECV